MLKSGEPEDGSQRSEFRSAGAVDVIVPNGTRFGEKNQTTEEQGEHRRLPFDPATYRPLLRGTSIIGGTRLSWVRGDAQVMKLFMRLKGQTTWNVLTISTSSFFDDRAPLAQPNVPEIREYMVCGCVNDQEVGNPSDIVSAVFAG